LFSIRKIFFWKGIEMSGTNSKKIQFNKKAVRDYIFIMIGAAIMAIGIGVFS